MKKDRLVLAARFILITVIVMLVILLSECSKTHAACVAAELVNGERVTIITGEIPIPEVTQAIKEKVKHDGKHTDAEYLAEVIYHENWHTDENHLAAYYTGAVVMNRVKSDEAWLHLHGDKTVYDVLYAKGQYSTTHKFFTVELPQECYDMAADIIENGTPDVPETVIYQSMKRQGSGVWKKVNTDYFCYE